MEHPKEERTLIIMKPDAIQRGLFGEIVNRFERKGLKIIGMKMMKMGDAIVEEHYGHHKDKPFFESIKEYIKATPVIIIALAGINAVSATRLIVGPTAGHEADAGSIRGDFSMSSQANLVHASGSVEEAMEEIERFFSEDELYDYIKLDSRYIYSDSYYDLNEEFDPENK